MKSYVFSILFIASIIAQDVFDGYTLFTPQTGPGGGNNIRTRLLDNNLDEVHDWSHTRGPASMPYLVSGDTYGFDGDGFENSILIYPFRVENPTMESGGVGGGVEIYNWEGERLWHFELSDNLKIHAGLRYSSFQHSGYISFRDYIKNEFNISNDNYRHIEPRLTFRYRSDPTSSIKGAYTQNYQYIHLASTSSVSLPTDLWIPSTWSSPKSEKCQLIRDCP